MCSDSNLALVASNDAVQDSKAAHPASPEALHQETEAATVPVATASIKLTPLFPLFNPTAAISVPMPAPVITNAIPASTPSAHSDLASSDMTHTKHTALVLYTAPLTNLMYTPRLEGSTHGTAPVSMVSRDTSLALVPYFGPSLVAAEVAAGYQMAAIRAYAFLSDSTSAHTLLAGMAGGHSNSPIFNRVLAHSTNWNGRRDLLPAVASSLALHSSYSGFAALTSYSSAALHVLASLAERFKMTAPAACINHSGSIAAFSRVGIVCDSASPITLKAVPRLGSSPVAMQLLAAFGQPRSLTAAASNTVKLQFSTIASPVAVPTLLNDSMLRLSPQLRKPFPLNGSFSHIEYLAKVACHLVQPSPSRAPLLPVPNVPRLELLTFVPGCVCGQPSSGKAVVDITYSSTDTHAAVVAFTVGSPASDKALTECPAEEATELGRRLELPQLQQQAFECMSKEVPTELHQVNSFSLSFMLACRTCTLALLSSFGFPVYSSMYARFNVQL